MGKQGLVLVDDGNVSFFWGETSDIPATEVDIPPRCGLKSGKDFKQKGFPRPAWAHDHETFPFNDPHRETFEGKFLKIT
jgi:hypothetical protein